MKDIFLKLMFATPKKLHEIHNKLPFSSERKKIKKVEQFVTNLYDKNKYVIHIKNLRQALNHG